MLQPREGSLFAILSRQPWWVSLLLAGALFAVIRHFLPDLAAAATALPFVGLAVYSAWLEAKEPSPKRVADTLVQLREMRWAEFSTVIGDSFRRDGYEVVPSRHVAADLEVRKSGYVTLLAQSAGRSPSRIGPLRELADAVRSAPTRETLLRRRGAVEGRRISDGKPDPHPARPAELIKQAAEGSSVPETPPNGV